MPTRRDSAYAAWVSISVGCNNTCTFCIVPALRGKEKDRRPGDILAEVEALVAEGVSEITLSARTSTPTAPTSATARRSQAAAGLRRRRGLERVRFTSPHPRDFTDDVIEAMAETPNVMPQLHMPLQSGSDTVLKAMRRSYRQERFLGIIEKVRAAMPDAAISTDIIVGFPGETEEDFEQTLHVVREARFAKAFTFQYSKRPGTPAADMEGQIPKAVVQERYERLVALQEEISWEENKKQVGRTLESWSRRAKAARTAPPTGSPAAPPTTAWSTSPSRPRTYAPGRGDRRDHLRRPAPPARRGTPPGRTPHPRRRRLGEAQRRPAPASPPGVMLGLPRSASRPAAGRHPGLRLRLSPARRGARGCRFPEYADRHACRRRRLPLPADPGPEVAAVPRPSSTPRGTRASTPWACSPPPTGPADRGRAGRPRPRPFPRDRQVLLRVRRRPDRAAG